MEFSKDGWPADSSEYIVDEPPPVWGIVCPVRREAWPSLTDAEWARLGAIRVPSLMNGFSIVLPSLPDPYPERRGPEYCWRNWPPRHDDACGCVTSPHTAEDWAGRGFTVRNDESTT